MHYRLPGSILIVALVVVGVTASNRISGSQEVPKEVEFVEGIVYGQVDKEDLMLDLSRPKEGAGPFPVLVCVHGGGWAGGSRKQYRELMLGLSKVGIASVTVDYRFAPKHPFPAQIEDLKCAVRWVRANAKKYNFNPDRIAAYGDSAGAHMSLLLGTSEPDKWNNKGGNGGESSSIRAMIGHAGPSDLALGYKNSVNQPKGERDLLKALLESFLGGTPEKAEAAYRDASPINQVRKGSPACLLLHGVDDNLVLIEQSEIFLKKMKESGVECELIRMEGAGHNGFGKDPGKVLERVMAFLNKHLKDQ